MTETVVRTDDLTRWYGPRAVVDLAAGGQTVLLSSHLLALVVPLGAAVLLVRRRDLS